MNDTQSTISDIKLFIERLKKDLPEVFGKSAENAETQAARSGKVLYRGDLIDAKVHLTPDQEEGVSFDDKLFNIYIQSPEADPSALLSEWLREKAGDLLRQKTQEWAEKIGVEVNQVFIKDQQTLWASCSAKRNINYSYRIIKMPEVIIDYLVIHELAHIRHMNHGAEYWELVGQFCPDYKNHRKWLNANRDAVFADIDVKYIPQEESPASETPEPEATSEAETNQSVS